MERHEGPLARRIGESLAETLWPTRCCVCDTPESLLCDACGKRLGFIDYWKACPLCGGPLGAVQCTECNPFSLREFEGARYPFDSCTCSVLLDDVSRKIIVACKDGGEVRLAKAISSIMASCVPASWKCGASGCERARRSDSARGPQNPQRRANRTLSPDPREVGLPSAVFYVPASDRAYRRRGFDHAEAIAKELADILKLPCWTPLSRPMAKDQRRLGRRERTLNASGSFKAMRAGKSHAISLADGRFREIPESVVLVDDVFTSGSTMAGAAKALKELGVERVHAVAFARTWATEK